MITGEKFKCPSCGGSSFGSTMDTSDLAHGPMHRYCHGNDAGDGVHGCTFNWPDIEDWKYFLVNGIKLSQEGHDAFREKLRNISVEGKPWPGPGA